jgi:hypothetical protein
MRLDLAQPTLRFRATIPRMRVVASADLDAADLDVVAEVADQTELEVRCLLPALPVDLSLTVVIGGRLVVSETGDGGASLAAGEIVWAVDATRPNAIAQIAAQRLRWTLYHELHHQARGWFMRRRATGRQTRSGERVPRLVHAAVCEGLASVFARDAAGDHALWAAYPPDAEGWIAELSSLPDSADYAQWMVDHRDGRRWIGYRAGTLIADRAIATSGRSAAELALTPSRVVLELAGFAAPSR